MFKFRDDRVDEYSLYKLVNCLDNHKNKAAIWTGEFRPPKEGEWYLSGSIVQAYKTDCDLRESYHIAKIVTVKKVEYYMIESE
jgi:hypothetical protein